MGIFVDNLVVNLLLIVMIAALVLSLIEHQKELKETAGLKAVIKAYDESDKVIKDCVVYTQLPITITGSNMAFISCRFENLGKKIPDIELKNILCLQA